LPSGGDAGKDSSPRLPKAAFQCRGKQRCMQEASEAVLCQGELLCTPEAAEAVLCQGELLCTPEAAEAAVLCQGRLLCMPEAAGFGLRNAHLCNATKRGHGSPGGG
jgi:hypothetical protein